MPATALKSPLLTCLFEQQRLLQQQMKLHFLDLALFHPTKLVILIWIVSVLVTCFKITKQVNVQNLQFFSLHSWFNCTCHLLLNFQWIFSAWTMAEIFAPSLKWKFAPSTCSSGRALQLPESHISKADTRGTSILMFPL